MGIVLQANLVFFAEKAKKAYAQDKFKTASKDATCPFFLDAPCQVVYVDAFGACCIHKKWESAENTSVSPARRDSSFRSALAADIQGL